jgi:membrane protein YqaA with SNARE-associated domain
MLLTALPPSLLWGVGTALGEVPPYLLARAASRASKATAARRPESAVADAHASSQLLERSKAWMERVLARHGFWGVVALSAYPNALFDVVGVCCGGLGMRFRTFLGATMLGKGIVKASWQCALFTMMFSAHTRTAFVHRVGSALDAGLPASLQVRLLCGACSSCRLCCDGARTPGLSHASHARCARRPSNGWSSWQVACRPRC